MPSMALTNPDKRIPIVITIDVEPDNAWEDHLNPSVSNVKALLRLQEVLARYGARATCLVTYRVVRNADAVAVLRDVVREGLAEIGAHLHPWETPPFDESGVDVRYPAYPHELSLDLFEQKLVRLTEAVTEVFGAPTSYRGGRWSIVREHLPALARLGYQVDSSVTPLIDWRPTMGIPRRQNGRGGLDYRFVPSAPYWLTGDGSRGSVSGLAEIPVTADFSRRVPSFVGAAYVSMPLMLQRIVRKSGFLRPVWGFPAEEEQGPLVRMVGAAIRQGARAINMALHSSEISVGGSPRSQTREAVETILRRIESVLGVCASSKQCRFATLTGALTCLASTAKEDGGVKCPSASQY